MAIRFKPKPTKNKGRVSRTRRIRNILVSAVAFVALSTGAWAQQPSPTAVFRDANLPVLDRIVLLADAMPAEQYAFRATDRQRTFGDLLADFTRKTSQLCGQIAGVGPPDRGPLTTGSQQDSLKQRARRVVANCHDALSALSDDHLADNVLVRTTGQDGPIQPRSRLAAMTLATAFWEHAATELAQYMRLAGRIPPVPCSGPSGDQNCDNSINRCIDARPGVPARVFTLSDAPYSVQSDGRGPYVRGTSNVGVVYLARIAVLNLASFSFDSLPRRSVRVDLSKPVVGDIGVPLGLISDDRGVEVSAQWGRDSNYVTRSLLDVPIDSTVVAQQVEVGFHVHDVYHALQIGPQPWGHCFSDGTAVFGTGTSRGTIHRLSDSRWEIDLPAGSIGRLFDISRSSPNAINKGLYYVSLHFTIER